MNAKLLPVLALLLSSSACTIQLRGRAVPPPPPAPVVTVHASTSFRIFERVWKHEVDGKFNSLITFQADDASGTSGHMTNDHGAGTWTLDGDTLVMVWPAADAPGGNWIDTVRISHNGRTYEGKNNVGSTISGTGHFRRVRTADL